MAPPAITDRFPEFSLPGELPIHVRSFGNKTGLLRSAKVSLHKIAHQPNIVQCDRCRGVFFMNLFFIVYDSSMPPCGCSEALPSIGAQGIHYPSMPQSLIDDRSIDLHKVRMTSLRAFVSTFFKGSGESVTASECHQCLVIYSLALVEASGWG